MGCLQVPTRGVHLELELQWRRRVYIENSNSGSLSCRRALTLDERRSLLDAIERGGGDGVVLNGSFPKVGVFPCAHSPVVGDEGRIG